ncbi:MAG: hypothetical protein ACFCGT_28065 [Sandaracinaceae bacterium]
MDRDLAQAWARLATVLPGIDLSLAHTVAEARLALSREAYAAVVCVFPLEGGRGEALVEALRQAGVPTVVVTNDPTAARNALGDDADVLAKPVTLVDALDHLGWPSTPSSTTPP